MISNIRTRSKLSPSITIYMAMVVVLAIVSAVTVFLPQGSFGVTSPEQVLPASKPVLALVNAGVALILYGGLGLIGLKLAQKLGFAALWDRTISNRQRLVLPALTGIGLGIFFILADLVFSGLHPFGQLPHPPFPTSIMASIAAGIGEEIIFRLFFISFWVWLIGHLLLKGRWRNQIFWLVAALAALAFALGHIPAVLFILGLNGINEIPAALMGEILLLNGLLSLVAAYYFRAFGFLAAVGVHFWADVVWHVIWGFMIGG